MKSISAVELEKGQREEAIAERLEWQGGDNLRDITFARDKSGRTLAKAESKSAWTN